MIKKFLMISLVVAIATASYLVGGRINTETEISKGESSVLKEPQTRDEEIISINPGSENEDEILQFEVPSDPQAALAWSALMDEEGEYAAYAMYSAVIDEFGPVEPYLTIREAENRHINALIRQLSRYGINVPENPYLGKILAPKDLQTAAEAWAAGEIANVQLYDQLLLQTTDSNLIRVFSNLRASSNDQHLPLFKAAAENGGSLTSSQMQEIGRY